MQKKTNKKYENDKVKNIALLMSLKRNHKI